MRPKTSGPQTLNGRFQKWGSRFAASTYSNIRINMAKRIPRKQKNRTMCPGDRVAVRDSSHSELLSLGNLCLDLSYYTPILPKFRVLRVLQEL